jgi:hypothetical protein
VYKSQGFAFTTSLSYNVAAFTDTLLIPNTLVSEIIPFFVKGGLCLGIAGNFIF